MRRSCSECAERHTQTLYIKLNFFYDILNRKKFHWRHQDSGEKSEWEYNKLMFNDMFAFAVMLSTKVLSNSLILQLAIYGYGTFMWCQTSYLRRNVFLNFWFLNDSTLLFYCRQHYAPFLFFFSLRYGWRRCTSDTRHRSTQLTINTSRSIEYPIINQTWCEPLIKTAF